MDVALFVPCYIDQLYPRVGLATAELLERQGVRVHFPEAQTCCGQPMANSGFFDDARQLARKMLEVFSTYEHVVCPSGSCTSMVRNHYPELLPGEPKVAALRAKTRELCEFLHDVLQVRPRGRFDARVGLDECCGFGGTFSVSEEAVSCAMGRDRVADHERAGAEVITSADSSCLMHLDGLIRRDGKKLRVLHVAELLEEATR